MRQLMIHVERIVRPVCAMQARKLRMRRELLTHLLSAVEEERASGLEEAAAVQKAVERLGNPIELTQQLQRAVPWPERLLLARFPVPRRIDQLEAESARRLYGAGPIGLGHLSILCAVAGLLSAVPSYALAPIRNGLNRSGTAPVHPGLFFLGLLVLWQSIFLLSCRFVIAEASPLNRPPLRATLRRAAALIAAQIALAIVAAATAVDRLPTRDEIIGSIGITSMFLLGSVLVARQVASLRRPYDEWLTLDIAR
jgi:hypothetical protein